MRVRTRFYYQGNLILIITGAELRKKLGMEISNLFSCPSSFFRKENNKESPGKIQGRYIRTKQYESRSCNQWDGNYRIQP